MDSNDQEKIEAIKKKYKEMATVPKRSRFAEFGDGIRAAGNRVGHVLAVFLGVIFLVVGINLLRTPVNYIVFGDKVSATIIDHKKKKIRNPEGKHSGYSKLVYIPIVEFHHKGKRRIAYLSSSYTDTNDIYRGKRVVVRYLEDSPEKVISEWPVKSISSYSLFLIFGAGLIFLIAKYGNEKGDGLSALPRDDYTAPIDGVVNDMRPGAALVFVREPSATTRNVMLIIALIIGITGGLHINSGAGRVVETWRIMGAVGFYAFFSIGILLLAVRRHKTIINVNTGRIEQHKGFFTYLGKKSWPISQFQSIMVDARAHYSDATHEKHVKYYLRMKGRQNINVLVDSYVDGITAAYHAKKLSKLTDIPVLLGDH